jgi:glycosyltransferase involved in cell wall biosynthesis
MARIFHVLDTLGIGGAENMIACLARWQASEGHAVHVHGANGGGPIADRLHAMQVPVTWSASPHYAPALWALYRQIRIFSPDVVHCHNIVPTLLGTIAGRLAGVKCLVTTRHGPRTRSEKAERRYWLAARWHRHVVAVSEITRADIAGSRFADPSKLVTISTAADRPDTTPPPDAPPRHGFTLVSVGRLVQEKSYETLLEALLLARAEAPDVHLWLVGDGVERAALEQRAHALHLDEHVLFLGARSNVGYWLQHADLFVMSSTSEGLPVSLLEAFAMERAVVATDAGGIPDAVEGAQAGLIVPSRDPRALAAAILRLKRDPDERRLLELNARRAYEDRFSIARMGRAYQRLYGL